LEIPAPHGGRGNGVVPAVAEVLVHDAGGSDAGPLVAAENERPILDDRSAGGNTKLVLAERPTALAAFVLLPAVGVHVGILQMVEQRAVQFVGAALET